jgi:hypothetical protein
VIEDLVSGSRQMTGCAGFTPGQGRRLSFNKLGAGESGGTFDRQEGVTDRSCLHHGASGKDEFLSNTN